MKHPGDIHSNEDMSEESSSFALVDVSPQPNLSYIIATATQITTLASLFDRENKREYPEAMDVEEEEMTRTPKKQKIEESDELAQSAKVKRKNKIVKVKGPSFTIQEYTFSSVSKE